MQAAVVAPPPELVQRRQGDRLPPYTIVRQTCQAALQRHQHHPADGTSGYRLDGTALQSFRNELDVTAVRTFGASLANDVNFTGTTCHYPRGSLQEASVIVLLHALDFGSGWRTELHRHHGRGAFQTIKPGVETMFRASPDGCLTSIWLESGVTKSMIADWFGLTGNPDLQSLVDLLHQVVVELGVGCRSYGSLEAFVEETLHRGSSTSNSSSSSDDSSPPPPPTPAGDFVWALVDHFPTTFNDVYNEACFYKKAQLVVGELFHRFRYEDARFNFVDGEHLTAFIDNVICATLRYKGIILLPESVTAMIESGQELPPGSTPEVLLRAAALCAIEAIVKEIDQQDRLTANELGNYLWGGLGKQPALRAYPRHATKTVFY